jgi:hypothetical protein
MQRRLLVVVSSVFLASSCLPKTAGSDGAITAPFTDSFDRKELGSKWKKAGGTWTIADGALHSTGEHNIPLFLDVRLPKNAKIEFTAWSRSPAVDTKVEVFGDGTRHESGYIVIVGGWNNSITTIARLDEHEKTRVEKRTRWEPNKKYRWTVQRTDGHTIELFLDGMPVIAYDDKEPLTGARNAFMAFSNWESDVFYDDLVITPLPD